MPVNGIALSAVAGGSIILWSGVKGWNLSRTLGEVITGKAPTGSEVYTLTAADSSGAGIPGNTASGAANDALKYNGHAYLYGGSPGKSGNNPWDCSSFANWVFGHDMGAAIPGYGPGQYDGTVHGPPTGSWGAWPGLQHVSSPEAGDLIVWLNHMGICIGGGQMISALNQSMGTKVTPIQGYGNGPLLCYGRYK